jgi:hypothetical protein
VGLIGPGWAERDHVAGVGEERAAAEVCDQLTFEAGLVIEDVTPPADQLAGRTFSLAMQA